MSSKEKLLASAQKNLEKGQITKAIKDYQQVVELDPKDIRNRQKLAELFCRARMHAEALGEYGAVARYYADNGFYLKAIAVYKQMQKLDPEQVNVYHRLAELNVKQGLVGNALAEYRNLVTFFEKKKLLADAIAVLQKMAELDPENLNLHVKIAEFYAQAGLRDKAREEFTQVLGLLRETGGHSRLARLYEVFLPLFPDDQEMRVGHAEALIRAGEVEKGLQLLKALVRGDPDDKRILKVLAFAYRQSEDFENERLTFQHLLKQAPGNLALREGYIRACLDGREHRRALAELEEWKEAFFDAGKVSVLRVCYENLLEVFPDSDLVKAALALIYEETGEEGEFPGIPAASEALVELEPTAGFAAAEPAAEELEEPAGAEVSTAEQSGSDEEDAGGAEEIPLEFLEAAADLGEPLPATPLADEAEAPQQVEIGQEGIAGEMELELELELDESLLAFELHPAEEPTGAAALTEESPAGFEADEVLEELEDLVELDTEEVLEELDPEGLLDELEEAEFYLQQGLLADAERVCRHLLEIDPGCAEAQRKLADLTVLRRDATHPPAEPAHFGLPDELDDEEALRLPAELSPADAADGINLDGVFEAFKVGVETPIDVEDTETHYNLGIAYKEMGLLDDAVAEFDKAMQNPGRWVDSLTLKGTCLFEKGAFDQAEEVFKSGLAYPRLNPMERTSLHYEMGLLYEAWQRPLEALGSFQRAADADHFFRDVGEKVEALRKTLGLEAKDGKDDPGAKGKKSRVSYV